MPNLNRAWPKSSVGFAVFVVILTASLVLFVLSIKLLRRPSRFDNGRTQSSQPEFVLDKPLILPGRISHTRLFPKFHFFCHSYLMISVPTTWTGQGNSLLSVDVPQWWRRGWLRVEAEDHLGRGGNTGGIHQKLISYLKSQGADPEEYAYAYLVTSPRVFNYKFSPASFWYLYSVDRKLKAMIAEVNNTFDERRLYFLPFNMNQPGETIREKNDDCSPHSSRANDPGRIFKHCWSKDFHVSPFASRKGGYTLLAQDPLRWSPSDSVRGGGSTVVDIEATLSSSKNRKKLIARLWSTTEPLDPALMSYLDQTRFICSWWWVGLMTFPRILFEALSLSFRRKLHIWYRPEVKPTTIGRTATTEEIILSSIFHKYLEHLIYHVQTPVTIQYTPAGPMSQQWTFHSFPNFKDTVNSKSPAPTSTEAPDPVSPVTAPTYEFHVLTPAFYSRLASFYSLKDALASEMLAPEAEENRTVYAASKKEELYHILLEAEAKAEALAPPHACTPAASKEKVGSLRRYHIWINPASLLDQLGWTLVKRLRRPPERGMYPAPGLPRLRATTQTQAKSPQAEPKASSSPSSPPPETTAFQISSPNAPSHPLDSFVQRTCNPSSQSAYRRAVLRLFLARHLAQGSVRLLRFYLIVVNLCFGVMGVWVAGRMKVESER